MEVDQHFRTSVQHIFAAGDVIRLPVLAATSMDLGRVPVSHTFGLNDLESLTSLRILGIHVIGLLATAVIHYGLMLIQEKKDLNTILA